MNRRQKIIVSITGIFIVLLALIGLTYAYFLTKITGNPTSASISVTTANLALEYEEGTPVVLSGVKIVPDTILGTKTFAVTNKGDATILDYGVYLIEVVNDMKYQSDVQIRMTCTTYATSVYESNKANIKSGNVTGIANLGDCNGYSNQFPGSNSLLTTNSINVGETQVYSLEVEYFETGENQTDDMGKELSGTLHIKNQPDVVDLEGTVTGASTGDYVQINSEQKISQIVNGKYKLAGVEVGTHTLKVMNSAGTQRGSVSISIKKGKTPGINGTTITVNENSENATLNITSIASTLTVSGTEILPFNTGTLAHSVYTNGATVLKTDGTKKTLALSTSTPDFTKIADGSDETTIGLFQMEDDEGMSYYYRGPVKNNYVNFAGYCWRIVRVEGDGAVRLILASEKGVCSEENLDDTSGVLRTVDGKSIIVYNAGLMPESKYVLDSIFDAFLNGKQISGYDKTFNYGNSVSRTYNTFSDKNKVLMKNVEQCVTNNNRVYDTSTGLEVGIYEIPYAGYYTFWLHNQYKCPEDFFKTPETKVFYLTADEVSVAGVEGYVKDEGKTHWHTITPIGVSHATYYYYYPDPNVEEVYGQETPILSPGAAMTAWPAGMRPAISLVPGTRIASGNGTIESPYVIN